MKGVKIYLTEEERMAVVTQRQRLYANDRNAERASIVLRPREDGEVDIIYAFSRNEGKGKNRRVAVQAVGMTASDCKTIFYRNLRYYRICGYKVDDWSRPANGTDWGHSDCTPRGAGDIPAPVANIGALAQTKYRYAGIDERSYDIRPAAYLRALHDFPGAELLFKAGLADLITPSILKAGRPMAQFIARNLKEIERLNASAMVVTTAFRRGEPLELATERVGASFLTKGIPRPKGVDALTLYRYIRRARISTGDYKRHATYCKRLGLDKSAMMPAPKHFRHVAEEVEAAWAKEQRRRDRIKAKQEREMAKKRGELFTAAQLVFAGVAAQLPEGVAAAWPRDERELTAEGDAMGNCIGNGLYARYVAEGEAAIVFLREAANPDAPWCDVELMREGKKWVVVQCYAKRNDPAPDVAKAAATTIAKALTKAAQRKARKAKKENRRIA